MCDKKFELKNCGIWDDKKDWSCLKNLFNEYKFNEK